MKGLGLAWLIAEATQFFSQWFSIGSPFDKDWKLILSLMYMIGFIFIGMPLLSWSDRRVKTAIEQRNMDMVRKGCLTTCLIGTAMLFFSTYIFYGFILGLLVAIIAFIVGYYACLKWEKKKLSLQKRMKEDGLNGII